MQALGGVDDTLGISEYGWHGSNTASIHPTQLYTSISIWSLSTFAQEIRQEGRKVHYIVASSDGQERLGRLTFFP